MAGELVRYEVAGAVARVTIDRPERRNALTWDAMRALRAALAEAKADDDVRVVVLTGAGDEAFCAGADLSRMVERPGEESLHEARGELVGVFRDLWSLGKPTIARVRGWALAGGFGLALACDLVVASSEARFCEIFVRRGLTLDFGGSWLLPRLVGLHRAKELAFLGDMVDAARAEAIGLVNRVVAAGELEAVAREMAVRLAAGPPVALAAMKQSIHQGLSLSLAETLEVEALSQTVCFSTADTAEAMKAFLERREPRFEGR